MATFKTRHYAFEYDPAMVQPVKITNKDGTRFYVLPSALRAFFRYVEREAEIAKLQKLQRAEEQE